MITAHELRERMNKSPFHPFRITMTDGRTFVIPNHDAAYVKRNALQIGLDLDSESFAQKYIDCAIIHITSVEDIVAEHAA